MAQVGGPGGCRALASRGAVANSFFPSVQLIQGMCYLEHGDSVYPLAGVDANGLVFQLGRPDGFSFLLRMHPPVGLDSLAVVRYAALASVLGGQVSSPFQQIASTDDLPQAIRRSIGSWANNVPTAKVTKWSHQMATVFVPGYTRDSVLVLGIDVDRISGETTVTYRAGVPILSNVQ